MQMISTQKIEFLEVSTMIWIVVSDMKVLVHSVQIVFQCTIWVVDSDKIKEWMNYYGDGE